MRYVVKQRIFSFGDSFTIRDEAGNDHFLVKGKVFTFGDKLRIYDMQDRELVYIEQKLFRFLPEYRIYFSGQPVAIVKKEFSFFKPRFHIESTMGEYVVQGSFWGMEFEIFKDGQKVAQVSKKWFSWSDTYGVEIADNENAPFMLALVIVLDQVLHDNKNNNNNN